MFLVKDDLFTSVANSFIEFKPTASKEFQMISKQDFTM